MNLVGYVIGFVGTDGSGKTTLAKKLIDELNKKGYPSKYVWFRFPYFFTLAILFIGRVTGFTKYLTKGKKRITIHHFHVQPFRTLYSLILLFDMILYYTVKVWIPSKLGYIVVCDRWIYDIFVDLSMDTTNKHLHQTTIGSLLYNLASQARLTLLLDAPDHVLETRRPETRFDPYASERRSFYRLFRRHATSFPGMYILDSDLDLDTIWRNLQKVLEQKTKIDLKISRTKVYAHIKSPLLRPFMKNKYVMLASNWAFQGIFLKTWGERSFQIMVDLVFAFPVFILLSFLLRQVTAAILAVIIAHTLTWTFNGNIWSLPKFTGATYDTARNIKFMVNLEKREMNTFGSIAAIAAFGSLSRGEFSETSDMDMRIIRNPGILNWVKANTFGLYLRSIAFIKKIPLDLFVLDNVSQIRRQMRLDEPSIVIYDPANALSEIDGRAIPLREIIQRYRNR